MNIGKIVSIEGGMATVQMTYGEVHHFIVTHNSVVHGHKFAVGDEVNLRFSTDNCRVVSVVPAKVGP